MSSNYLTVRTACEKVVENLRNLIGALNKNFNVRPYPLE